MSSKSTCSSLIDRVETLKQELVFATFSSTLGTYRHSYDCGDCTDGNNAYRHSYDCGDCTDGNSAYWHSYVLNWLTDGQQLEEDKIASTTLAITHYRGSGLLS